MPKFILRLSLFATIVLLQACSTQNGKSDAALARPNILILMAEDLSSRVGAFGDEVAVTPNLDSLAKIGVRFPNTFTTAGVCAPSRAAHITAMHQIAIGAQHMRSSSFAEATYQAVPPPTVKAYPELLRHSGYTTVTNHKLDYQFSAFGAGSGPFTIWDYQGSDPDWTQLGKHQPFYALINLPQTHESQLFDKNLAANRSRGLQRVVQPSDVTVPPYYPDTAVVREYIARQYNNVYAMDEYVGAILRELRESGVADNTIVIWTTDHGDGLPRAKREIYDSGIKVPMIIFWPADYLPEGAVVGGVDQRLISFVDFGPSILSWAGVAVPEFMHGTPTLVQNSEEREYIFASKDRLDEHPFRERAIRDNRFKYIRNYAAGEPGAKHIAYRDQLGIMMALWQLYEQGGLNAEQAFWFQQRPAEELYDIETDPDEVHNLATDPVYLATRRRLSKELDRWLVRIGDSSEQPEIVMADAFWPGGVQPLTPQPVLRRVGAAGVVIDDPEAGASLGYKIGNGRWLAYSPGQVIDVKKGQTLSAKAVRYGWRESVESHLTMP